MFEYLYGTVEYKKMDYIAIDINGVGIRFIFHWENMRRLT